MKVIIKLAILISLLITKSAYAEEYIKLQDNKKILGTWNVTAEAAALNKDKKLVDNDWTFDRQGKLTAVSKDRRFSGEGRPIKINYSIEDGMIKKQFQPGRTKYELCKVVKLQGREMILHCKFNYFFLTKK